MTNAVYLWLFYLLGTQAHASILSGASVLNQKDEFTQQDKDSQIRLALYDGLIKYYQSQQPEMAQCIENKVTKPLMLKNIHRLLSSRPSVDQSIDKNTLYTNIRTRFNPAAFERNMRRLPSNTSDQTHIVLVEFFAPLSDQLSSFNGQALSKTSQVLTEANYSLSLDSDALSSVSGGQFNYALLDQQFKQTGKLQFAPILSATVAQAGAFNEAYTVVVTHQINYEGTEDMLGHHLVSVRSTAKIFNAHSQALNKMTTTSTTEQHESLDSAINLAIQNASESLSSKITAYFQCK